MARLIINPTSSSRREIALPRTLLSIGRDPSNDLVLPDAMVSRRHAVIELRGNQYFLRDCNSSNGSLVNGDRVSERALRDGDLVAIGTARLLFRDEIELGEPGAKVVHHPSAPRQQCAACGADYRKGDFFCRQCGAQIEQNVPPRVLCVACGTSVALPAHFCNACGTPLGKDGKDPAPAGDAPVAPRDTEERLAPVPPASPPGGAEGAPEKDMRAAPEPRTDASEAPLSPFRSGAAEPAAVVAAVRLESPRREPVRPIAEHRPRPADRAIAEPARGPRPVAKPAEIGGLGVRLLAGIIDGVVVGIGQLLLLSPVLLYWWSREWPRLPQDVPFAPILLTLLWGLLIGVAGGGYYVYYWGTRGTTPGKRLLDLSVEGEDGAFPIGVPRALGRLLAYLLSFATLGVGFLMITGGVALHDRIAGTRVVRRRL